MRHIAEDGDYIHGEKVELRIAAQLGAVAANRQGEIAAGVGVEIGGRSGR